jgi:hypothetical protein
VLRIESQRWITSEKKKRNAERAIAIFVKNTSCHWLGTHCSLKQCSLERGKESSTENDELPRCVVPSTHMVLSLQRHGRRKFRESCLCAKRLFLGKIFRNRRHSWKHFALSRRKNQHFSLSTGLAEVVPCDTASHMSCSASSLFCSLFVSLRIEVFVRVFVKSRTPVLK